LDFHPLAEVLVKLAMLLLQVFLDRGRARRI